MRRMIGVIPQALTSDQDLTVEENLSIYAKLYSVPQGAAGEEHRRSAGSGGSDQVARRADEDAFRRHAAAAGDRARAGARSAHLFSRRADDGTRSGLAHRGLGDAEQPEEERAT